MIKNVEKSRIKAPNNNLIDCVLGYSKSNDWDEAKFEWEIISIDVDPFCEGKCICGHHGLKYLYTIRNMDNDLILYPVGSECIRQFNRRDFDEEIKIKEALFNLYYNVESRIFVSLTSEFFTRDLLLYLFNHGAFKPTIYNNYNPEEDYDFMVRMFNKRNVISEACASKVRAILITSIIPYIREILIEKKDKDYEKFKKSTEIYFEPKAS